MKILKLVIFIAIYAALSVSIFACGAMHANVKTNGFRDPKDLVQTYCELDYTGQRCKGETFERIAPLITFNYKMNELSWDSTYIVRKFEIESVNIISEIEAQVVVHYDILGVRSADSWYPTDSTTEIKEFVQEGEKVVFFVIKSAQGWKITNSVPENNYPHVSLDFEIKNLETAPVPKTEAEELKLVVIQLKKLRDELHKENLGKPEGIPGRCP